MKIALIGYGKMGHEIEKIARERGHDIVCTIDINEEEKFSSDSFKSADVAIEFTSPKSALFNYKKAFEADVPVVSGTTGWLEHIDVIKNECNNNGKTFFYASNFSLGVNLFFALNNYLSKLMNRFPDYDVRMEETHHIHKLDAPSGTAITLAEDIVSNIERKNGWVLEDESQQANNAKTDHKSKDSSVSAENKLNIASFKEGEEAGIHSVIYDAEADSIQLTHVAQRR